MRDNEYTPNPGFLNGASSGRALQAESHEYAYIATGREELELSNRNGKTKYQLGRHGDRPEDNNKVCIAFGFVVAVVLLVALVVGLVVGLSLSGGGKLLAVIIYKWQNPSFQSE